MEFIEGLAASGGLDEAFEFFVRIDGGHNCLSPCCVRMRGFRPRRGVMAGDYSGAARGKRDGAAPRLAGCFGILVWGLGGRICLRPRRIGGRGGFKEDFPSIQDPGAGAAGFSLRGLSVCDRGAGVVRRIADRCIPVAADTGKAIIS